MRGLIRGARDAQGPLQQGPGDRRDDRKEQTGLKLERVEESAPYLVDPNLDISKYEAKLRDEEATHRKNGRLSYTEPLSFNKVIDASLVHKAAAEVK